MSYAENLYSLLLISWSICTCLAYLYQWSCKFYFQSLLSCFLKKVFQILFQKVLHYSHRRFFIAWKKISYAQFRTKMLKEWLNSLSIKFHCHCWTQWWCDAFQCLRSALTFLNVILASISHLKNFAPKNLLPCTYLTVRFKHPIGNLGFTHTLFKMWKNYITLFTMRNFNNSKRVYWVFMRFLRFIQHQMNGLTKICVYITVSYEIAEFEAQFMYKILNSNFKFWSLTCSSHVLLEKIDLNLSFFCSTWLELEIPKYDLKLKFKSSKNLNLRF